MAKKDNKTSYSKYAKFSMIGIQMGVIIGGFAYLGVYLDDKYDNKTAWWTLGLSLFGVATSLYILIKEVINMSKEDNE